MIVTPEVLSTVIDKITASEFAAVDTETTGLRASHGDRLFSIIVAIEGECFYFNYKDYNVEGQEPQHAPNEVLPRSTISLLQDALIGKRLIFMHNAKFDLAMLALEGLFFEDNVWCTMVAARVEHNDHAAYSLEACAERIGETKDDAVEEYIKKYKCWTWVTIPGKKTRVKDKHYDQVPFEIISPYGLVDGKVTYLLGMHQKRFFEEARLSAPINKKCTLEIADMERRLTPVCFDMEQIGIKIDRQFCEMGSEYEDRICIEEAANFKRLTGLDFVDSNKVLAKAFTMLNEEFPVTAKGNPSFREEVLNSFTSPVAQVVKRHREASKRLNTYFRGLIYHADKEDVIHANMKPGGTATGRFSYSDPNLQNLPKEDKSPYPIRKAFIPRDGYKFVAIDYAQMEFRMMLDIAGQEDLIGRIIDGHDPHTSTAELCGIGRKQAKTLNFALLYGMGIAKLADTLGTSSDEARTFKQKYFAGLPKVKQFLRQTTAVAEKRGHVFDWAGRRFYYPDSNFCYKAANSIIQGGCSSVVKYAMLALSDYLSDKQSRMLVQIHDEILFEIHESEVGLVPELQRIMENIYPYKQLPLTCSVEESELSWGDMNG